MKVFDTYNGHTKAYGIIGNPIEHSFSLVLQNTILSELNFNGVIFLSGLTKKILKQLLTVFLPLALKDLMLQFRIK